MRPVNHPSLTHPEASQRRRLTVVVVLLAAFLGLVYAAVEQSRALPTKSTASLARPSVAARREKGASTFQHILDDLDPSGLVHGGGDGPSERAVLSVAALNDLRNELRRLKRPLKVLLNQLDPLAAQRAAGVRSGDTSSSKLRDGGAKESPQRARNATVRPSPPAPFAHRLQYSAKWSRGRSIFVAVVVAAHPTDESDCVTMVDEIFQRAAQPEHVQVGLVEVYGSDVNISALPPLGGCVNRQYALCNQSKFCATDHIRVRRVHGKMLGQQLLLQLALSMYRGEQYVLLTRGTLLFPSNWDSGLLEQLLGSGPNPRRSLLTSHEAMLPQEGGVQQVSPRGDDNDDSNKPARHLVCSLEITVPAAASGGGGVRVWRAVAKSVVVVQPESERTATASLILTTAFVFGHNSWLVDVPLDATVTNVGSTLYDVSLSMRLFAESYRVFALPHALCPQRIAKRMVKDVNVGPPLAAEVAQLESSLLPPAPATEASNRSSNHSAGNTDPGQEFWKSLGVSDARKWLEQASNGAQTSWC